MDSHLNGVHKQPLMSVETSPFRLMERRPHASLFVGRTTELDCIMHRFNAALQGERQLVFLSGPLGIGKTALVDNFLKQVRATRPHFFSLTPNLQSPTSFCNALHSIPSPWIGHGQCIEHYGAGEAYLPLLEALSRLGREPDSEAVVATVLARYAPTWLVQLPSLVDDQEYKTLHRTLIGAARERMLREIAEALEELSLRRPLVLVLEDLHWSDLSTLEGLAYMARRRGSARLFILGTYRPAEACANGNPLRGIVQDMQGRGLCTELRLGLLSEAQVTHYLSARLAAEVKQAMPLHRLAQVVHQRTEGNPLFMVTMMKQWVREGVIEETAGQWRVKADLASLKTEAPHPLRQLIEQQFDALRSEEQRVLEIASVVGTEFEAAAVAAVAAQPIEVVDKQFIGLAARGQFIREQGVAEWSDETLGGRYRFLHVLYQNILYERIAKARRILLHRRIGDRKEAAYGDTAREIAAELVMHFEAGQDYQRAVEYLTQAREDALQRSAHAEACQGVKQLEESYGQFTEGSATKDLEGVKALLRNFGDAPERAHHAIELARQKEEPATPLTLSVLRPSYFAPDSTPPHPGSVTIPSTQPSAPHPQRLTPHSQSLIPSPQPLALNTFRHDGKCWMITFDKVRCRLDDTFGMRYIAVLLQRPHQVVHVRELAGEPLQSNEKTRVNVTRAIKTAIKKLTRAHRTLGVYLTATIKTGTTCSYRPPDSPSITW